MMSVYQENIFEAFHLLYQALVPISYMKTYCTALVHYRSMPVASTIGFMLTPLIRQITYVTSFQMSVLIGNILGHASLRITSNSIHALFIHSQTLSRVLYSLHIFMILQNLWFPKLLTPSRDGKMFYGIHVVTRAYPILTQLYLIFYSNGIKIVPLDFMFLYINAVVFAYWIIDDGSRHGPGLILITHSFTFQEVYGLAGIFHSHFGFSCTVQNRNGKPVLYIRKESIDKLRSVVEPYILSMFRYKIGI